MILEKLKEYLKNIPEKDYRRKWRSSKPYRVWRAYIILSQKRCQICGSIKNRQAHHIYDATNFPEKRFQIENGVCLCKKCHTMFHTNFKRNYRQKCDLIDWENFKILVEYIKGL